MAALSSKFASNKQDWVTPVDLFDPLNAEFGFTLDAAASPENARVSNFIDAETNGLASDWGRNVVWLNPPYGDRAGKLSDWVKKSLDASRKGATIVMLIPARTNTTWFHDICLRFGEVRFVRGRPKFSGAHHGLPQPLCLVVFRPELLAK